MSISAIVITSHDHVFTTSLLVAEKFNKNHRDVLKAIRNLECSEDFSRRNFAQRLNVIPGPNNSIRQYDMYQITRDGFAFLAMGFTGKEAARWKEQFINAFNHLEKMLAMVLVTEHHALLESVFARYAQWRETLDLYRYGFSTREIADLQGKHISNVQRMLKRIRAAGIECRPSLRLHAA
jgi:Rha family phage regulatory protein